MLDRAAFLRAAAAFAAAPLAAGIPSVVRAQPAAATVRIATIPIDAGAQAYYAEDLGFFKRAGIAAEIQSITNGSAIASAVASNAVDVGFANLFSIAAAHKRGLPFVVIAPAATYTDAAPTSELVVEKNSKIASAKDLNGKTIAVNGLKNITQFAPQAWMDQNGGDAASAKFVELPFPEMAAALAAGRVDAALLAEPSLTQARGTTRVLAKAYSAIAKEFLIGGWFTTTQWAAAHGDVVKRFDDALRDTSAWANKNHRASAVVLAKYAKIDINVLNAMTRASYPPRLTAALMQPPIDVSAKYGLIDGTFPAQELIYAKER
ncbi:MAG: ABC transporter substrate-binding protein [Candidatus Velthaea sp.]